ncbi:MAG: radical SAM/SPASM domain protein, ACGX system [Lachnospirales bacterium]
MKPYFAFQWHITDNCDQRCEHCYIFADDKNICLTEMNFNNMKKVINDCIDMCNKLNRTPYFYITGGDPILHKNFWDLCQLLKQNEISFGILGNPFHLNDEVCKRLVSYGCKKYQLSIDGARETHDKFRKKGSFDTTIEKISCIKKAGMYCAIMSTVSSANMNEFSEIIDIVVENEVDVFAFGRYCPSNNGNGETFSNGDEFHIQPLQYKAFLETCYEKYEKYKNRNTHFQFKDHLWKLFLYEKGIFEIPKNADKEIIYDGCHCGISHITILPNGDVYACRRMESKIGNILETSIYDIFLGQTMEKYRDFNKFEKCAKCELYGFCRGCPAVAYGYTGDMYSSDPQCWKEV